jgi:hypothetical protein
MKAMKKHGITRRVWLVGASCLGLGRVPSRGTQTPPAGAVSLEPYPGNAAEGLLRLQAGIIDPAL